jgi:hypothetical protein
MSGSNGSTGEGATWWQAALMIRGQTEADQRNIRAIWIWTLIWGASFAAATIALERFPQLSAPFAWLLAMAPFVLGVPTVRVYLRFFREADEFMRKVQFEGIALGFGAGFVFCIGYHVLEQVGAPELPMMAALLPMSFGWAIGSFLVAARYR